MSDRGGRDAAVAPRSGPRARALARRDPRYGKPARFAAVRVAAAALTLGLVIVAAALAWWAGAGGADGRGRSSDHAAEVTPAPTATAGVGTGLTGDLFAGLIGGWPDDAHCRFTEDDYRVVPAAAGGTVCLAPTGALGNFDLRVGATAVAGPATAPYGVAFRQTRAGDFYVFTVDSEGLAWVGRYAGGTYRRIAGFWPVPAFAMGPGARHVLRVVASGPSFACWVDGALVGTARDATYPSGRVGVFAGDAQLTAAFVDFEVTATD